MAGREGDAKMRARAVVWVLATSVTTGAACGTNFGTGGDQGDGGPADGGDDNPGITMGDATVDGSRDGSLAESSGGDAALDVEKLDGCVAQQPDVANGVFVSPGGQMAACGSPATPCTSIQAALTLAAGNGKTTVYVDSGTYTEKLTLLGGGITVQGGWTDLGGNWTRQCTSNRSSSVVVQAPNGDDVTVLASYSGAAALDTLTIQSEAQGAVMAGESVYGVFATGASTTLTLTDVNVNVVHGGDGTPGGGGVQGQPGAMTGCNPMGNGATGGGGTAGAGGTTSYDVLGFHRGDAQMGTGGGDGGNGTAPTSQPTCFDECATCICDMPCGGSFCCDDTAQICGNAGLPGCGGHGGGGGQGGVGGGAGIDVFAWDATVTIAAGAYATGGGGVGGDGGPGASGGGGEAGVGGGTTLVRTGCHLNVNQCIQDKTGMLLNGGPGGPGGTGGTGAGGGGGAGGDTYCYYAGPMGKVNASGWSCTPGAAGKGGNQGGSNQGANGNAGMHN
jgi:hypothetical protein